MPPTAEAVQSRRDSLTHCPVFDHALTRNYSFETLTAQASGRYGRWAESRCAYCWEDYKPGDDIIVAEACRHMIHFKCFEVHINLGSAGAMFRCGQCRQPAMGEWTITAVREELGVWNRLRSFVTAVPMPETESWLHASSAVSIQIASQSADTAVTPARQNYTDRLMGEWIRQYRLDHGLTPCHPYQDDEGSAVDDQHCVNCVKRLARERMMAAEVSNTLIALAMSRLFALQLSALAPSESQALALGEMAMLLAVKQRAFQTLAPPDQVLRVFRINDDCRRLALAAASEGDELVRLLEVMRSWKP